MPVRRSLVLLLALAAVSMAQAPPAVPAPKPAAPKVAPKPKAPATPQAGAALKPEVAAQSDLRGQVLKQKKKARKPYRGPRTDLNGASREDLMKLPGVTAPLADRMIAGRPYLTKAHLVTRDVIPYAVYLEIKERIVAVQKPKGR